jgi:thiol-disulfide isomerase/thioredoxin
MKFSHKDKSLLLFITAVLVVLWSVYSFFSYIFFNATYRTSDISKVIVAKNDQWLNTARPLELEDFKGRVILLDFWTYACVNCIQALPEIKKLEEQFGSKLTVIGVHSGKFNNEKNLSAIKKAILKYDITHPVVNDPNFEIWNNFGAKSWPTFVLINPHGNIEEIYSGENELVNVKEDVSQLIKKYKYQINRDTLPVRLEKHDLIGNVLNFPTKLAYVNNFSYKSRHAPAIFIANSGHNDIVVSSLTGDIILKIGSGREGFEDGTFDAASFNKPQGMLYSAEKLYVADTGNHAIRVVDFKEGKVTTLLGSGQRGQVVENDAEFLEAKNLELASPTDIEFFPNKDTIAIANSGTHQILSYDLKNQKVAILAGNGSEGIDDGQYPDNSLAQTADMSVYNHKLYFVDSESSSLRVLDENGYVKTLIGKDLFKFGHQGGDKNSASMQHPLGLIADDTGIYVSDSFNHVIRKYDFSGQMRDLVGSGKVGDSFGKSTQFNEPEGIVAVLDRFYIADSNNNRILVVSRGSLSSELLEVMPPLKLPKEGFLEYLPNLQREAPIKVSSNSEAMIKINIEKGWKLNEAGPSFVNLLQMVKDSQAVMVESFDWNSVKRKEMKLPKLNSDKDYLLQGTIYYCEDKVNSLCYIKSYEREISADEDEKNLQIEIKLGDK